MLRVPDFLNKSVQQFNKRSVIKLVLKKYFYNYLYLNQHKKRVDLDNYLIEKYKEDFKDSKIKIDTYIKKLGIQLKNIFTKIDQLYIYSVPHELSLTGAKVIIVLKEKEFMIFEHDNKQKNAFILNSEMIQFWIKKYHFLSG